MRNRNELKGRTLELKQSIGGYAKGTLVKIHGYIGGTSMNSQNPMYDCDVITPEGVVGSQLNVYHSQLVITMPTKEDYEKIIRESEEEIAKAKSILKWMEETSNEVYDADEHKVWEALTVIEAAGTKGEKAKEIAKLLK